MPSMMELKRRKEKREVTIVYSCLVWIRQLYRSGLLNIRTKQNKRSRTKIEPIESLAALEVWMPLQVGTEVFIAQRFCWAQSKPWKTQAQLEARVSERKQNPAKVSIDFASSRID